MTRSIFARCHSACEGRPRASSARCPLGPASAQVALGPICVLPSGALSGILWCMKSLRYVYWQDQNFRIGYFDEFPDYMTQGESLEDLKEHLRDLYRDLVSGEIPAVRRVAELEIA